MTEYIVECWKKPCDEYGLVFASIDEMCKAMEEYGTCYAVENYCVSRNNGHISDGYILIPVKVKSPIKR